MPSWNWQLVSGANHPVSALHMGIAECCTDSHLWEIGAGTWRPLTSNSESSLYTQKHKNTEILVANVLTYYWPTYWIHYITVFNYSFKLLLANMHLMAYPSDLAQSVQCKMIVLLSSLDLGPFCSSCQRSSPQLWGLKISHQAQRRKRLKMRHFPHSRCLLLWIYAGNFSVLWITTIPRQQFGCVVRISQRIDGATPSAVREAAAM